MEGEAYMSINNETWQKLAESREYRKLFVEALAKSAFAAQIRTIRKSREWPQEKLAKEAEITQGVVSRAEDPNLGTTFSTAAQIASGFDLAFIPMIVPFSEFVKWVAKVSEGYTDLPSFEEENASMVGDAEDHPREVVQTAKKKPPQREILHQWAGTRLPVPPQEASGFEQSSGGQPPVDFPYGVVGSPSAQGQGRPNYAT